jgi:hypothetical protein
MRAVIALDAPLGLRRAGGDDPSHRYGRRCRHPTAGRPRPGRWTDRLSCAGQRICSGTLP